MGTCQKWALLLFEVFSIRFQATEELFSVLGRQDDKCKQSCENTIVYFGFPVFEDAKSGRFNYTLVAKLFPLLPGHCEGDGTGYAKFYLKQQVKVTKDFQSYTFLR